MTVARMVVLMCDGAPDLCDEESDPGADLAEARSIAKAAGWQVGRTLDHPDYCPKHAAPKADDSMRTVPLPPWNTNPTRPGLVTFKEAIERLGDA